MKRTSIFCVFVLLAQLALAGGLVTNTNQSSQWVRMLSRNASLQIDAVYFNPAGLTSLENGLHLSVSNQFIFQEKPVISRYALLNDSTFLGKVRAPLFPSAFAAYKMDLLTLSFGFGPVGGGGSAEFAEGLPSFEIPLSQVVPLLSGLADLPSPYNFQVTGYDADLYFSGSSVYYGFQAGASLRLSDMLSGYAGIRYTPAKNSYSGHLSDVELTVNGQTVNAPEWLTGTAAPAATTLATSAQSISIQLTGLSNFTQQLITGGIGSYTLAQAQTAGYISSAQKAQMEAALVNLGLTPAQVAAMNLNTIKGTFSTAANNFLAQYYQLTSLATSLNSLGGSLGDLFLETTQTGAGWTPVLGINVNFSEQLNLGIKYEFKTELELTNSTTVDDFNAYPDGETSRADIPALLSVGLGYQQDDFLKAQLSYNLYFDKDVDWGLNTRTGELRQMDKNYWELALGMQFGINEKLAVSLGGLISRPGVDETYQSDFSYSNPSFTLGGGLQYKFSEQLTFDAGLMKTFYEDQDVNLFDPFLGDFTETYKKETIGFAIGVSYSIF